MDDEVSCTEPDINDNGQMKQSTSDKVKEKSLFQEIFQCFDVVDNYNRLFETSSNKSFLSTIAGMRLAIPYTPYG